MMKLIRRSLCALAVTAMAATAQEAKPAPQIDLNGSVQIQWQKSIADNGTKDNLDEFWGRANLTASFKDEDYQSLVNIRVFPAGWGVEVPNISIKGNGDSVYKSQPTELDKFLIEQAWIKYMLPMVDIRVGRFFTSSSKTFHMGNFLDQNAGPGFQTKLSYHNAIDGLFKFGNYSVAVLLGAGDKKLNTGYLRIQGNAALLSKKLNVLAGYRANVFDRVVNSLVSVKERYVVGADYEIMKDLKPFVEVGIIDTSSKKGENKFITPMTFGTYVPSAGWLNAVVVEAEYLSGRTAKDLKGKLQDVPLQWNLYLDKKLGKRTRLQGGIYSWPAGASAGDMMLGMRYTGTLK